MAGLCESHFVYAEDEYTESRMQHFVPLHLTPHGLSTYNELPQLSPQAPLFVTGQAVKHTRKHGHGHFTEPSQGFHVTQVADIPRKVRQIQEHGCRWIDPAYYLRKATLLYLGFLATLMIYIPLKSLAFYFNSTCLEVMAHIVVPCSRL